MRTHFVIMFSIEDDLDAELVQDTAQQDLSIVRRKNVEPHY